VLHNELGLRHLVPYRVLDCSIWFDLVRFGPVWCGHGPQSERQADRGLMDSWLAGFVDGGNFSSRASPRVTVTSPLDLHLTQIGLIHRVISTELGSTRWIYICYDLQAAEFRPGLYATCPDAARAGCFNSPKSTF